MQEQLFEVNLASIILDWNFYPRTEVSKETVMRLREAISSGIKLPPMIIDKESMKLIDGFHRHEAYRELKIETVEVEKRFYKNDQEMIRDAGLLNANHGRPFSSQDCRRFILLASSVGLTKERIAGILNVTKDKIDEWSIQRAVYKNEEIPIKRGLSHLIGQKLTKIQKKLNEEWGGMNATFYVNQLILYFEADAVRPDDFNFIDRMEILMKLWQEKKKKFK